MSHRLISNLCWVASALAIGGSLVWLALAEDKGHAILGGLVAVALSRVLIGEVARWHEEKDAERRRNEAAESEDRDADNR